MGAGAVWNMPSGEGQGSGGPLLPQPPAGLENGEGVMIEVGLAQSREKGGWGAKGKQVAAISFTWVPVTVSRLATTLPLAPQ